MNGTWRTTGGGSGGTAAAGIVVVAALAAVVVSWILTKLLLITLIALALLAIAVLLLLVVRRIRHPEGPVQLARQPAMLHADAELQAVGARPATAGVHFHGGTHIHIGAGDETAAALIRNSITGTPFVITENKEH